MSIRIVSILVGFCCLLIACTPENRQNDFLFAVPSGVTISAVLPQSSIKPTIGHAGAYYILSVIDHRTGKECFRQSTYIFNKTRTQGISKQNILQLPSGQYSFLAWIDYRVSPEHSFYDTSDLERVTMIKQQGREDMQAYAACTHVQVDENQWQKVELLFYQPVSFYRFLIVEHAEKYVGKTLLIQHGAYYPIAYNVLEGRCTAALFRPKWTGKIYSLENDKACLFEGAQFTDHFSACNSDFQLYVGNEAGYLLFEMKRVSVHLSPGKVNEIQLRDADFQNYTEGGIIDGDFSGDIDIEI